MSQSYRFSDPLAIPINHLAHADIRQALSGAASLLLGGMISEHSLFYFIGGIAVGRFKTEVKSMLSETMTHQSTTRWGWLAGSGISLELSNELNLDLRYQYQRFNPITIISEVGFTLPQVQFSNHLISLRLSYHFSSWLP